MVGTKHKKRTVLAFVAALALAVVAIPAEASTSRSGTRIFTFAIIGDAPYGGGQPDNVDALIDDVNNHPDVRTVIHLGDTKSGSTECSDEYNDFIADVFDRFDDPLYYTPGDNEWTDCHRANNGAYVPTERLDAIRETYFSAPGKSLSGRGRRVLTQKSQGYPENQVWHQHDVEISLIHLVGSNNGALPWFDGTDIDPVTGESLTEIREAEVAERTDAAITWMHRTFDRAEKRGRSGIMFVWHGDLWAVFENSDPNSRLDNTDEFVQQFSQRAAAYGKPVLIVNGDTHDYYSWKPLSDSDTHPLAEFYLWRPLDLRTVDSDYYHGPVERAENVEQVVFDIWDRFSPEPEGFGPEDFGWLTVTIDRDDPDIFSFEQQFIDLP